MTNSTRSQYFQNYGRGLDYDDSFFDYFDPAYIVGLIECVWKVRPPYSLLDLGSANGLTLAEFAKFGIEAWGVENDAEMHRRTPAALQERNLLASATEIPLADAAVDFIYETCLCYLPRVDVPKAISEMLRVTRKGVIFSSITADLHPDSAKDPTLYDHVCEPISFAEWSEYFIAGGFEYAVTDESTLQNVWNLDQKLSEKDGQWYQNAEQMRRSYFSKP